MSSNNVKVDVIQSVLKTGDILTHLQLKKLSKQGALIPFVCNPQEGSGTHAFVNGNFYRRSVDAPRGFKHLLSDLNTYNHPPSFEMFLFEDTVVGVFEAEKKPVAVLNCLSTCLQLSYEVVMLVTEDGAACKKPPRDVAGMDKLFRDGWIVLCNFAQQDLEKQLHHVSSYTIGKAEMKHTCTFHLLKFDNFEGNPMQVAAEDLARYVSKKDNAFSDERINTLQPSRSLSKERPAPVNIEYLRANIQEFQGSGKSLGNDPMFLKYKDDLVIKRELFMKILAAVEIFYRKAREAVGSGSYREDWMDVFTHCCLVDPDNPCNACEGCNKLMCQVCMLVLAAQGVSDKNVLSSLGAVFRHPRYANLDSKKFLALGMTELTLLFKKCSKQVLNAHNFFFFLYEVEFGGGPPTHLEDITCFRGFNEKTGCLYFLALLSLMLGIAPDRWVVEKSIELGLVPSAARTNPPMVAKMLESWIPIEKSELWNNLLGGTAQIMDCSTEVARKVQRVAYLMGNTYVDVCRILTPHKRYNIWTRDVEFIRNVGDINLSSQEVSIFHQQSATGRTGHSRTSPRLAKKPPKGSPASIAIVKKATKPRSSKRLAKKQEESQPEVSDMTSTIATTSTIGSGTATLAPAALLAPAKVPETPMMIESPIVYPTPRILQYPEPTSRELRHNDRQLRTTRSGKQKKSNTRNGKEKKKKTLQTILPGATVPTGDCRLPCENGGCRLPSENDDTKTKTLQTILPGASVPTGDCRLPCEIYDKQPGVKLFDYNPKQMLMEDVLGRAKGRLKQTTNIHQVTQESSLEWPSSSDEGD